MPGGGESTWEDGACNEHRASELGLWGQQMWLRVGAPWGGVWRQEGGTGPWVYKRYHVGSR